MNDRFDDAWALVPDMGRIQHLPHKPNTDRDDLVASEAEASIIFGERVIVEEKIDGSQVAIASDGDGAPPIIRNKNHVLVKGYGRKNTPAKAQYASLWNWVYENADSFAAIRKICGETVGVYGEWIYAEHTICYDRAPTDFIAYEIYLPSKRRFLNAFAARDALSAAGFAEPLCLGKGVRNYAELERATLEQSAWSSKDAREGVVVKVCGDSDTIARFKMRRGTFRPREDFNDTPLRRRPR